MDFNLRIKNNRVLHFVTHHASNSTPIDIKLAVRLSNRNNISYYRNTGDDIIVYLFVEPAADISVRSEL